MARQLPSLLALSTRLPAEPDLEKATDGHVFSPSQVIELRAELDLIDAVLSEGDLSTRAARMGTRRR